jgi:hypothetical protein
MIIYLLSFIFRTLLWEKLRVLEFGYANPPDWSSPVIIIAWFVEFLILFFLLRRYRIKKNASWGKVIVVFVITDLLYLVAGFILIYLLVATSLWVAYPQGV